MQSFWQQKFSWPGTTEGTPQTYLVQRVESEVKSLGAENWRQHISFSDLPNDTALQRRA